MGTLVFVLMLAAVAVAILSGIAAGWFNGWRDFLERL